MIDPEKAEAGSRYLQNAMGNFTNGLYDGKMYLMTQDASGNVQEWYGNAAEGVFETFEGRTAKAVFPSARMRRIRTAISGSGPSTI